jgi:methyltransferase-like protein/cyclopropane fatty-acyl-phospholipid synthase-like methyltransferase
MTDHALADAEMEASIARTALKYDLLPYQSKPFAQSQPARLGALARLFALDVAPLESARVLELGCAAGGNIIPHAARYPGATFVGVDLARTQVAAGRARIKKLGLNNIEIHCQSFTEIGDELGHFDYIICHGVYSWVPAPVQDAIFRIIRDRLSPVGVACVSYNVLPGWRMLQPLRDAFLLQIPDELDSRGRVAKARELLTFMKDATADKGPYGDMLRAWADRLAGLPDDYIAHEFLEETNAPSTVRDFTASAARHRLGYLGECELSSMILENHGAGVAERIRARAGNDLVESEQYLDLLSGRTFRQSLLVGAERMTGVNRALSPERIAGMHFLTPAGMTVAQDDKQHRISDPLGRTLTTDQAAVAEGFAKIIARYPASTSLDQAAEGQSDEGRAQLLQALYQTVIAGMVTLSNEPVAPGPDVSAKPRAIMLAQADAAANAEYTTNQRHETVAMDAAAKVVLPRLDGKSDAKALAALLLAAAKGGELSYNRDGMPITDADDLKAVIEGHVPNLLAGIAQAGLLEA